MESLDELVLIDDMFETLVTNARLSLADTPNRLPILREAGVVDAGAMGLVCFLQGIHERQCGATSGYDVAGRGRG